MKDIGNIELGRDLRTFDSSQYKAKNVMQTQLGSLDYAPTFGVDLKYFLESDIAFQTESLQAYILERLSSHQVTVDDTIKMKDTLEATLSYYLRAEQETGSYIA